MPEPRRPRFAPRAPVDLADLAAAYPLAWLVSADAGAFLASPLPLLPVAGPDGAPVAFVGHCALANPQLRMLERCPRALALFLGPHGYLSPASMGDRSQAPTWNYASAAFTVDVALRPGRDAADRAIRLLVEAVERDRPAPWRVEELGARYERLLAGVMAFDARVVDAQGRFKLGQDERDDVYAALLSSLACPGGAPLAAWMRRFNPGRPPGAGIDGAGE